MKEQMFKVVDPNDGRTYMIRLTLRDGTDVHDLEWVEDLTPDEEEA